MTPVTRLLSVIVSMPASEPTIRTERCSSIERTGETRTVTGAGAAGLGVVSALACSLLPQEASSMLAARMAAAVNEAMREGNAVFIQESRLERVKKGGHKNGG